MTENINNLTHDYSYVSKPARIAVYDDMKSSPRIIEIKPNTTKEFIGQLASLTYNESNSAGGQIAFTVIKQVAENCIHAAFNEVVVTIMPGGNEIKFSDQGPGIQNKEKAMMPGFSSATQEMKQFIDGVGSGLPIANEYLKSSQGSLKIEDNVACGTVVTLSLNTKSKATHITTTTNPLTSNISTRGVNLLNLMLTEGIIGVKDAADEFNYPSSSVHSEFAKLEELNLIERVGTKRQLTKAGKDAITSILG